MRKKVYGQSKIESCPFCGKQGTIKNKQGISVCKNHKEEFLLMKCVCGEYLDAMDGKYGAYFKCANCGNLSFNKAMSRCTIVKEEKIEKKPVKKVEPKKIEKKQRQIEPEKEEIIMPGDPRYFS